MGDSPLAGDDDEFAVVVQITPRNYRTRAIACIAGGILLTAVLIWLAVVHDTLPDPFLGVMALGYGIYCAGQARRQVTYTVLSIDRSGFRTGDGLYDRDWAGVVMVWVGSPTGLRLPIVRRPAMSIFTELGVDFARRAGTRPKVLYTVPVGRWEVSDLCRRLGRMTDAAIVNGTQVSRRRAAAALESRRDPASAHLH